MLAAGDVMTSFWSKAAAAVGNHARGEVIPANFSTDANTRRSIRRDPPPSASGLAATDDQLRLRLAEEIEYARRMLDIMGDELTGDGAMVVRHARALQSIDIVGQMLGHLATVIRSNDPEAAIERIGMTELKARLTRKSL